MIKTSLLNIRVKKIYLAEQAKQSSSKSAAELQEPAKSSNAITETHQSFEIGEFPKKPEIPYHWAYSTT